jgi:hypothetical protein
VKLKIPDARFFLNHQILIQNKNMRKKLHFRILTLTLFLLFLAAFSNLGNAFGSVDFTLAWDANTEEDLDGYEVYIRTPNSDYELIGDVYVDELADPDNPMVTVTNLYNGAPADSAIPAVNVSGLVMEDGETYYLALTAFDTQGNSSDFSDEICLEVTGSSVAACNVVYNSPSSSAPDSVDQSSVSSSVDQSSGGGGGGCFISSIDQNVNKSLFPGKFIVMFSLGMLMLISFALKYNRRLKKHR